MTDATPPRPSRKSVLAITAAVLIVCFALIWRLVEAGDPANSLHASALAWAFSLAIGTVGAFVGFDVWAVIRQGRGS